ncbi:AMP-binding protein, partial [Saccharothrix hoggarensis]
MTLPEAARVTPSTAAARSGAGGTPPAAAPTIVDLFAEQVRGTPDGVAVVAQGVECSYAELDARADRLARRLLRLGVRPEQCVGVLADRSADLVAALLAVVRAGGAYVPLDTRAPAGRMTAVLTGAGVSVLVTDRAWRATAERVHGGHLVVIEDDEDRVTEPGTALPALVHPDNLAYVMFTSGSTGV